MVTLFPTFGNWLQRTKRLLACDTRNIWQHIGAVLEADEQRYISECRAKGVNPYAF